MNYFRELFRVSQSQVSPGIAIVSHELFFYDYSTPLSLLGDPGDKSQGITPGIPTDSILVSLGIISDSFWLTRIGQELNV